MAGLLDRGFDLTRARPAPTCPGFQDLYYFRLAGPAPIGRGAEGSILLQLDRAPPQWGPAFRHLYIFNLTGPRPNMAGFLEADIAPIWPGPAPVENSLEAAILPSYDRAPTQ